MSTNIGLGFNADGLHLSEPERNALKTKVTQSKPGAMVILTNLQYAIDIKNASPRTNVVFRQFWGDNHDSIHLTTTPDEYIYRYNDALKAGLTVYTVNEPFTDDPKRLCDWELEVARKVLERGGKSVHMNWSVGMPSVEDKDLDNYAPLLKLIGQNRGKLFWGVHEYFFGHPFIEFGMSHLITDWGKAIIPLSQKPWVMGRYRWTTDYCDRKGIPRPNIILTEFGWDDIYTLYHVKPQLPGYEYPYRLPSVIPSLEKWAADNNMDWQSYAAKMMQVVWCKLYRKSPDVIGACFFSYGGTGAWDTMSVHRYETLVNKLSFDYNYATAATVTEPPPVVVTPPVVQPPVVTSSMPVITTLDGTLNVRSGTNIYASIIGRLKVGSRVLPYAEVVNSGGYKWRKVKIESGQDGWIAVNAVPEIKISL